MNISSEETRHYPLVETNNISEVNFPRQTGQQIITELTNDIAEDISGDGLSTLTDKVRTMFLVPLLVHRDNESSLTSLSRYFITKISLAVLRALIFLSGCEV